MTIIINSLTFTGDNRSVAFYKIGVVLNYLVCINEAPNGKRPSLWCDFQLILVRYGACIIPKYPCV